MWSRNTNTECVDLDQNIAGRWQADESGGSWRLSKDNQAWVLRPAASGRWEGELDWPHYGGVRIIVRASLRHGPPLTLSFRTDWGCRWTSRRPKPVIDDDE
jgi:hypothetical protein